MKKKVVVSIVAVAVFALAVALGYRLGLQKEKNPAPPANEELAATKNDFAENIRLIEKVAEDPEKYRESILSSYQMSKSKANEFLETPENWLALDQIINIENVGDQKLSVYGFKISDNGKNGIYISKEIGGRFDLRPGSSIAASFSALCDNADLSLAQAKRLVDETEVKIIYSKTPETYGDGSESVEPTKTAVVRNVEKN